MRETVRVLADRVGEGAVSGLVAAAGPCARACCYEVGEETAEALSAFAGKALRKGETPGKWFADLQAIALAQLAGAGIMPSRMEGVGAVHDLLAALPLVPAGKILDRPPTWLYLYL